jgi:hypothetical protein
VPRRNPGCGGSIVDHAQVRRLLSCRRAHDGERGDQRLFGWTLGASSLDSAAYVATSVAIDAFKVSLPLLAKSLWANRHRPLAVCAISMWFQCITWSANVALGLRSGPGAVVRAELNAAVVVGSVWQRGEQCTDITLDESRAACAEVLRLRQELATAEAAERLESKVAAGRAQLATVSVTGSDVDPQATVLASLIRVDQVHIRAIALLLAFIFEAGSALGFAIIATAAKGVPSAATPRCPLPTGHTTTRHANPARLRTSDGHIRRWALSELDIDPGPSMPAPRAYDSAIGRVAKVSSRPPRPTSAGSLPRR